MDHELSYTTIYFLSLCIPSQVVVYLSLICFHGCGFLNDSTSYIPIPVTTMFLTSAELDG